MVRSERDRQEFEALSDERLVERSKAGDRSALDELFRRYVQVAYRVAYRQLGNHQDALDAAQDGLLNAATRLETFRGQASFRTWVLRVFRNASLDLGRERGRRPTVSLDALVDPPLSCGVTPQESAIWTERVQKSQEALDSLPEHYRIVMVLRYVKGLTRAEIARVIGSTQDAVRNRLARGRARLRRFLQDPDTDRGDQAVPV